VRRGDGVVNGEVLFAQGDDPVPNGVCFRGCLGSLSGREKEFAIRMLSKLRTKDSETARGVPETLGHLFGGEPVDEMGSEGFVLSMGGVARFQESPGDWCYVFCFIVKHSATISEINRMSRRICISFNESAKYSVLIGIEWDL